MTNEERQAFYEKQCGLKKQLTARQQRRLRKHAKKALRAK